MMSLAKVAVLSAHPRLGANGHHGIEVAADFDAEEAGGRDAENFESVAVESDRFADRVGVAAVLTLPERIADYGSRGSTAGPVVPLISLMNDMG